MTTDPGLRRSPRRALLLSATALALVSLPAVAQNAVPNAAPEAASGAVALPELSVTGRAERALEPVQGFVARQSVTGSKTDTPILEVPQSLSVITRDSMNARQVQTLEQAMSYSAGVQAGMYGNSGRYDWFRIRGFDAHTNGIYLDGLRYNLGALTSKFEPYGLERLEVLRGPASVLFGQNEPGGMVNMVSRRPTQTAQGEVRLSAGTNDRKQAEFTTSGPLDAAGEWSYSLTGVLRDANLQSGHGKDDRTFIAPALTWRPSDNTRFTFLAHYQRDLTHGDEFLPYTGTVTRSAFGRVPTTIFSGEPNLDHYNRTVWGAGYEFEHRFDEVFSVRQNLRYTKVDYDWYQTYGLGLASGSQRLMNRYAYQSVVEGSSIAVDNQLEARFDTGPLRHTVLAGLDYSRTLYGARNSGATASPLDLYRPVYAGVGPRLATTADTMTTTDVLGLYLQDQIRFGERWVATVGIRQDWYDQDVRNRRTGGLTSSDGDAFTWRAGLTYQAPNGLAPYVSYTESFMPETGVNFYGEAYEPTTGRQYEAGVKYQPPGGSSFAQLAVFDLTKQNVRGTDPNNPLNSVQTGEIRVRGVELEAMVNLAPGFDLLGSLTWWDAEITRSTNAATRGNRPNGVPEWLASLYAQYSFAEATGPISGLTIGGGVRYVGRTPVGDAHLASAVPAVTLFDAAISYDLSKLGTTFNGFNAQVNARNLEDKRFVASCGSLGSCFYGEGRSVIGTLAYRW
ncbi:TonB-dependent siderophore receptor [Pseudoroseomonas cervicalis]|uniref:TonB-dependent siderophore receptor n=1 Tax=Teichococcus cervicalis TaxID=204525 RepID=UPI002783A411|nr:TonB-dependent siderophore receptor [Pseudoroseomonas cervicalis]MDQ1081556.1 iron complex outermembrane receptor protein [Pseudoroseomonas cervicalis]